MLNSYGVTSLGVGIKARPLNACEVKLSYFAAYYPAYRLNPWQTCSTEQRLDISAAINERRLIVYTGMYYNRTHMVALLPGSQHTAE